MTGTWKGFYTYGPEYGNNLYNEKCWFMFFITKDDEQFEGTSVDYDGVGAELQKATIKGFVENAFINFTKQYPFFYQIDEQGNIINDETRSHPEIHYSGSFDEKLNQFSGEWEMVEKTESDSGGDLEYLNTGKWEMKKEED